MIIFAENEMENDAEDLTSTMYTIFIRPISLVPSYENPIELIACDARI